MAILYDQFTNFFGIKNVGDEEIPPYAVVQIYGKPEFANKTQSIVTVKQPFDVDIPMALFAINDANSILPNQSGTGCFNGPVQALISGDSETRGSYFHYYQAQNDSWRLHRANRETSLVNTYWQQITGSRNAASIQYVQRAASLPTPKNIICKTTEQTGGAGIPATENPDGGNIASGFALRYLFDKESETLKVTDPPEYIQIYNHTKSEVAVDKFIQAKWIDEAYFIDVEPCE